MAAVQGIVAVGTVEGILRQAAGNLAVVDLAWAAETASGSAWVVDLEIECSNL